MNFPSRAFNSRQGRCWRLASQVMAERPFRRCARQFRSALGHAQNSPPGQMQFFLPSAGVVHGLSASRVFSGSSSLRVISNRYPRRRSADRRWIAATCFMSLHRKQLGCTCQRPHRFDPRRRRLLSADFLGADIPRDDHSDRVLKCHGKFPSKRKDTGNFCHRCESRCCSLRLCPRC